jgi:SAM-dependent methyltransferase
MRSFTIRERAAASLNILPTAVYDAFPAVLFGRIVAIASTGGVFSALSGGAREARELAMECSFNADGMELLLPLLASGGYLKRTRGGYALTRQSRKWLLPSSAHYIGNFIAYLGLLHDRWNTLGDTLRSGKPRHPYTTSFGPSEWRLYVAGMMDLARLTMPFVGTKLILPRGAATLLDVGGSHGLYAMELCRKYEGLRVTIADLPEVLHVTKEIVDAHGVADRVTLLPLDVTAADLPRASYDAVLAFNIIHGFDRGTNQRFVRSIAASLVKGGIVYFLDQLKGGGTRGVRGILPLVVGLNLMNEIGGSVYGVEELKSWCANAGLGSFRHRELRLPGVDLVSAAKE